jgi:putative lipoprotein
VLLGNKTLGSCGVKLYWIGWGEIANRIHDMLINKLSMLVVLIIIFSLSGCASVNSKKNKDEWFAPDKAEHFVVSAAIGAGTAMMLKNKGRDDCRAAAGGVSMSVVLGAGKEYHDKYIRKKYWSWKDMFWNLVGGVVGSLVATDCH